MLAPDIRLIASVLLKGSTATTSPEVMLPCAVEPKVRTVWVVVAVRVVKPGEERTATTWPEVMLSYNQRTGCEGGSWGGSTNWWEVGAINRTGEDLQPYIRYFCREPPTHLQDDSSQGATTKETKVNGSLGHLKVGLYWGDNTAREGSQGEWWGLYKGRPRSFRATTAAMRSVAAQQSHQLALYAARTPAYTYTAHKHVWQYIPLLHCIRTGIYTHIPTPLAM